jgi:ComF family protein
MEGAARALVHALMSRGALAAADLMAAQIAANAPAGLLAGAVVPVPADPGRRRRRGFDHAELLARALARRTRLPVSRCLVRAPGGERQLGRSRAQRLRTPGGAIAVRRAAPGRVLLVDDVHTTGATLAACARALREAGARNVGVVTYARTLR